MDFKELGQSIAQVSPILGTLLAGPAGGAVGSILAAEFGGDPTNASDLLKKIQADPDAQAKLAQIQSTQKIQLQTLTITAENNRLNAETAQIKSDVENVESARKRESDLAISGHPDNTTRQIAIIYTVGYFLMVFFFARFPQFKDATLSAGISAGQMIILGYYFGSSLSSRNKDKVIAGKNIHAN